ncbi:hypothetical protein B9Z55_027735 [Caenorhabditis nigoni]|nr:hypothetical protein B9Z55_027735 [Caenorhabditis nigoni]
MIVLSIWKSRNLAQSFVILTANFSLLKALYSSIYLFYIFPMISLDLNFLKEESYHVGYLILIICDASTHIHFIMSINRLLAVFVPLLYFKTFRPKTTRIVLLVSFLSSFGVVTLFFVFLDCRMGYLNEMWMFDYSIQPYCLAYMHYYDLGKALVFAFSCVVLDFLTVIKLIFNRRKVQTGSKAKSPGLQKKEVDFLKQSLTQNLVLFLTLAVYYLAPQIYTDRKTAFLGSTLFWCILNAFDGLVIIKYNSDVRGYIRTSFKKETSMVVVSVGGSVFY